MAVLAVGSLLVLGGLWAIPTVTSLCDSLDSSDLCTTTFDVRSGGATTVPSSGRPFPTRTVALSPDGGQAALVLADVEALSTGLYVIDLDSGTISETLVSATDGNFVRGPAWSPDGSTIAAAVSLDGELSEGAIAYFDAATGELGGLVAEWDERSDGDDLSDEQLFWIGCRDSGMAFSVDGSHVACSSSAVDLTNGGIQRANEAGTFLDYGVGLSFVLGATEFGEESRSRFDLGAGEFPYAQGREGDPLAERDVSPATMAMHPSEQGVLAVSLNSRSSWLPRWSRPWGNVRIVDILQERIVSDVSIDEPIATAAWSHDGTRAVLVTPDARLYVLELASVEGGEVLQLDEVLS